MNTETFKFLSAIEVFLLSPDEEEVLLIHRSKEKEFLPDLYAGLGGKMDFPELETPLEAAYREVEEESFYKKDEIENLRLKGIITVNDRFGKWNIFDFVGKVNTKHFDKAKEVEEGTLEWVKFDRIPCLNLIPDLKNGTLEEILFSEKILWMKSIFDKEDNLINFTKKNG